MHLWIKLFLNTVVLRTCSAVSIADYIYMLSYDKLEVSSENCDKGYFKVMHYLEHFCKIFRDSALNTLLSGIFNCLESSILSCFRLKFFFMH